MVAAAAAQMLLADQLRIRMPAHQRGVQLSCCSAPTYPVALGRRLPAEQVVCWLLLFLLLLVLPVAARVLHWRRLAAVGGCCEPPS
jgi:uncharacterized iron-regulated membrane protein